MFYFDNGKAPLITDTKALIHLSIELVIFLSTESEGCPELDDSENYRIQSNGTTIGSVTTYTCSDGYELTAGSSVRVCQANSTWSGSFAVCTGLQA